MIFRRFDIWYYPLIPWLNTFQQVAVEFDQTDNVAPKTNVKLKVSADKDSVVNVLVVDKSVKLLKEGNDITPERVSCTYIPL